MYHGEHQKGNADDNHPNADALYLLLSVELVYNEVVHGYFLLPSSIALIRAFLWYSMQASIAPARSL